jgi:hypothetical protein
VKKVVRVTRKIAPIVITVLICSYALLYMLLPVTVFPTNEPLLVKFVVLLLPAGALAFVGAAIFTLVQRLKEIDEEDKDDLSKY